MKPKKSIIIAGSRGIGRGISKHLQTISKETIALSSKDFDTSKIHDTNKFVKKYKSADVLVLNTGGPPPTDFYTISNDDWLNYFNQLFLSFCLRNTPKAAPYTPVVFTLRPYALNILIEITGIE